MGKYAKSIEAVRNDSGNLLDAILAAQAVDGYLTEEAMCELAEAFGLAPAQVYETASFYSMIRFTPAGKTVIQVCRNAPCHVAGAVDTIEAIEKALGVKMGESTPDGRYTLEYTECVGQCQDSPSVVVNGELHSQVTADKVPALLKEIG